MALSTYSELQASIADWLNRSDLTSVIPDFIALAEARFNRELRTPDMEATATITADAESEALPTDFLGMRSIYIDTSPDAPLGYFAPQQLRTVRAEGTTGQPRAYTIIGSNLILAPAPGSSYTVKVDYYQKVPDLATNSTNWLLTAHPDLYLTASLVAAGAYIADDERLPLWKGQADEIIASINMAGDKRRRGSAPLVTRPATYIR